MKESLTLYYSPQKIIGIMALLALAGSLFIWADTLFLNLLAAIMWIAFLSWLIKLFNRKPQVIVSIDGFLDHRTKFNLIPWEDIDSIFISKLNRISFYFTNPETYLKQMNIFKRMITTLDNKLLGYGSLTISYVGLTGNSLDIIDYIVYLKSIKSYRIIRYSMIFKIINPAPAYPSPSPAVAELGWWTAFARQSIAQ